MLPLPKYMCTPLHNITCIYIHREHPPLNCVHTATAQILQCIQILHFHLYRYVNGTESRSNQFYQTITSFLWFRKHCRTKYKTSTRGYTINSMLGFNAGKKNFNSSSLPLHTGILSHLKPIGNIVIGLNLDFKQICYDLHTDLQSWIKVNVCVVCYDLDLEMSLKVTAHPLTLSK